MSALIVPMNVCALVVGEHDDTSGFARLTHSFADLRDGVYLAQSVAPGPFDTGAKLEPGVHLHWALPAALARGDGVAFKAPPNRWLVARLPGDATTAWVVESDRLWDTDTTPAADDPNVRSRPVPLGPGAGAIVRRLGRVTPLASWKEQPSASRQRPGVGSATASSSGFPLTAMGYGDPSFSAAYPLAPNVFGMWDPVKDAAEPVTYLVAGWHSDPANDPLAGWATGDKPTEALAAATGWTLAGSEVPERMLCAGVLTGVLVDLDASHLSAREAAPLEVAVGHTGVEALAALLAARDGGDDAASLELALTLLQEGLLPELERPNGLAFCEDRLHTKRFVALPGGTDWRLEKPTVDGADPAGLAASAGSLGEPLPQALADSLDALNDLQRAADAAQRESDAARSQLFADWCKYLEIQYGTPGPQAPSAHVAAGFLKARLEDPHPPEARAAEAANAASAKQDELKAAAEREGFVLTSAAGARFWRPGEPVVLLSGADVARPDRYGRDGQTTVPFTLPVRTTPQVTGTGVGLDLGATTPFADDLAALLAEAQGSGPPGLALAHWSQPWIPLLLDWELEFTPDADGATYDAELLVGYEPDYTRELTPPAAPAGRPHLYSGSALLAGNATLPLGAQIDEHVAHETDEHKLKELRKVRADLGRCMLAQALGGLGDAFLMRHQALQLPVHDPRAFGLQADFTRAVAQRVGGANDLAAMPLNPFSPLPAGRARITKLRIVDAFGQVHELEEPSIIRATAAKPPDDPESSAMRMPARLQQGARLNFRWISAVDDALESSHPASSPVCGWLLFNRVEDSLAVYDADGVALGSLHRTGQVWRDAPGALVAREINAHLKHMAETIAGMSNAPAFLADLFDAIDATLTNVATSTAIGAGTTAALVARPLALVRARLDLELLGPPARSQSWADFDAAAGGGTRSDAGIGALEVPVELGDLSASDDGLIGYFHEGAYDTFLAPAAQPRDNGVRPPGREDVTVRGGPAAPPVVVSMIVDPTAGVYAGTGLLPRKRISIPPAMYATTLRHLTVTFQIAPVLSARRPLPDRRDRVGIPVPSEPGFDWTWLTPAGESLDTADVEGPALALDGPARELADGWLALTPSDPKGRN